MDPATLLSIGQATEGLPGALNAFHSLRKGDKARSGAGAAYLAYQNSATEAMTSVGLIVNLGVPPRIVGGLWTWPTALREHRRLVDAVTGMITAFGQMVMLGNYDVVEAGYEFGMRFTECCDNLPRVGRRISMTEEYRQRMEIANKALRVFLLAARKDLGIRGRNQPLENDERPKRRRPKNQGASESGQAGATAAPEQDE